MILSLVLGLCLLAVAGKEKRKEEKARQGRFGNICSAVMLAGSMSGLISGYSIFQCIGRLLYFWEDMGTWMLYPLLVLILLLGFCDKRWIPVWVLLETAVILDWGEFLYELPVLPHGVYILLYIAAGIWAAGNIWTDCLQAGERKRL